MLNAIRRLFAGRGSGETRPKEGRGAAETVPYKGFTIEPASRKEGTQWLTAGIIRKEGPEGIRETRFVRSDTFGSRDNADECAVAKARQIIDERGDKLFEVEWP